MGDSTNKQRWIFENDDDGHTYLIPLETKEEFNKLLSENECEFIEKFDNMRIGMHFSQYSFTDPKEL